MIIVLLGFIPISLMTMPESVHKIFPNLYNDVCKWIALTCSSYSGVAQNWINTVPLIGNKLLKVPFSLKLRIVKISFTELIYTLDVTFVTCKWSSAFCKQYVGSHC